MREIPYKNIFSVIGGNDVAICVPTNGRVKGTGEAVMGKGLANIANNLFHVSKQLGKHITRSGNHVYDLGVKKIPMPSGNPILYHVITFPTKDDWKHSSNVQLIRQSAEELVRLVDKINVTTCYLPAVGCGLGGLDYKKTVRPILQEILDDRFIVIRGTVTQAEECTDFVTSSRNNLVVGGKVYVLVENGHSYHVMEETLLHQTNDTLTLQMENEVVHFMSKQDRFLYGSEEDCTQAQQYLNAHDFKDFTRLFPFQLLREVMCSKLNISYDQWTTSEKAMLVNMVEDCEDGHYPIILQWTIAELRKFKNWCNTNGVDYNNLNSFGRWKAESDFKEQLDDSEPFVLGEVSSDEVCEKMMDFLTQPPTINTVVSRGNMAGCKELLDKLEDTVNK